MLRKLELFKEIISLEEMNEYASAKEMFYHAYSITPTDDLARSIIRV